MQDQHPVPVERLEASEAAAFAVASRGVGLTSLYTLVNPLTMWLTLATFVGYT